MQFGILHSGLTMQADMVGGFPAEGKNDTNGEAADFTFGNCIHNFYGAI